MYTRQTKPGFSKEVLFSSPKDEDNQFDDYKPNRDKEKAQEMYKFH